jgi:glyoxylase-like metal-dependent hydrolase (beta-lactamase superfamily II)
MVSDDDGGTMEHWTIGEVGISSLLEIELDVPAEMLIAAVTPATVAQHLHWLQPNYLTEDYLMKVAIQSILVESRGKRIVVDTCYGNDRNHVFPPKLSTDYLERLTLAGFAPSDVDFVLCTHLHPDHIGWNTRLVDGKWTPTFPNARYLVGHSEYDHWMHEGEKDHSSFDCIEPVLAAGLLDFVEADNAITEEVHIQATPGHTPGHVSVAIHSGTKRALISGDMIHHPVQVLEQEWSCVADRDPAHAISTRIQVLEGLANAGAILIGTHFRNPAAGKVQRNGSGWVWEPLKESTMST